MVYQINIFSNKLNDLVVLLVIKMLLKEKILQKILLHLDLIEIEYLLTDFVCRDLNYKNVLII
jgi:hypothetical protein